MQATSDEAAGTKWLKHYSSEQSILTVGDGDFSFSLALATAFGSGKNLVATSLDSYEELNIKYNRAASNVKELERLGATVLHGVDVKEMDTHAYLAHIRFDRIVFNFPHAGFNGREDTLSMIKSHQELVRGFFTTARGMVGRLFGQIHVTHKTKHPYSMWGIQQLASESSLTLLEEVAFQIQDYGDGLHMVDSVMKITVRYQAKILLQEWQEHMDGKPVFSIGRAPPPSRVAPVSDREEP